MSCQTVVFPAESDADVNAAGDYIFLSVQAGRQKTEFKIMKQGVNSNTGIR